MNLLKWLEKRRDKHLRLSAEVTNVELKKLNGIKARAFKEVIDYVKTHEDSGEYFIKASFGGCLLLFSIGFIVLQVLFKILHLLFG
jgi:hypothetical protein